MFEFMKKNKLTKTFYEAVCIKTGVYENHTFKEKEIYAICGANNGHQLVYENKEGDAKVILLCNKGELVPFDETPDTPRFLFLNDYWQY